MIIPSPKYPNLDPRSYKAPEINGKPNLWSHIQIMGNILVAFGPDSSVLGTLDLRLTEDVKIIRNPSPEETEAYGPAKILPFVVKEPEPPACPDSIDIELWDQLSPAQREGILDILSDEDDDQDEDDYDAA